MPPLSFHANDANLYPAKRASGTSSRACQYPVMSVIHRIHLQTDYQTGTRSGDGHPDRTQ